MSILTTFCLLTLSLKSSVAEPELHHLMEPESQRDAVPAPKQNIDIFFKCHKLQHFFPSIIHIYNNFNHKKMLEAKIA
jgi:hypothetical protein